MDKVIEQSKYKKHFRLLAILVGTCAVMTAAYAITSKGGDSKTQYVSANTLTSAAVHSGHFADKLRLRGTINPQSTVYLDAVAGGRVEEKLVVRGQFVEKGQPLIRLSNVSLQLDVMSREAQVTEQLNFLRNTQMTMTTNRLNLRRDLLEIDLKISHLNRKIKQVKPLVNQGLLPTDNQQSLEVDLKYFQQRKTLTTQRQDQEDKIRQVQVLQLEESAKMLQENLVFARTNLDDLLVRAPVSGYLSELNVELGESKDRGARLGQVDIPKRFKLVANLDEYYLSHIALGMSAQITLNGQIIDIVIEKIDSRVRQSQFRVELNLPHNLENLKSGQSLELDLILSQGVDNSLLLKRGSFVNNTGGNWAFVLNKEGTKAQRRLITLGKKNKNYYQVLSGLEVGDVVITSNYNAFDKADSIQITGQQ
jgi:HlyD family secretion protein